MDWGLEAQLSSTRIHHGQDEPLHVPEIIAFVGSDIKMWIYFNYVFRLDYPTSNRVLSTCLVWLNITFDYNNLYPLEPCDILLIKSNSNLKRLEGLIYDGSY
ncbi:hypothetical protein BGX31_002435 [Mortierella sp. GBA43]|nr:hypothetical protein BGX31_002435 [Mortierella sp. GBA43]